MHEDIAQYNQALSGAEKKICEKLAACIDQHLPQAESKVWHRHPVWFLEGNPVVGYAKLKDAVQLLFWSGQSFDEVGLDKEGSFKAAQKRYTNIEEIDETELARWLKKAEDIQWDYKNIVKHKGVLERVK